MADPKRGWGGVSHNKEETPTERELRTWSFYDAYKIAGQGKAAERPDMETFSHVSEETKQKDRELLKKKKGRPKLREQRETGPDAFAFENFLTTHAKEHHWFGGELSPTTEFDDWISGADAVVEWPGDGEPVRLAVDFTAAEDVATFFRKSDKLEGNVRLKYLRSAVEEEGGHAREVRASVPIVLLGFDESVYRAIAQRREELGENHPLRRLLVEQAAAQVNLQIQLLLEKVFESPRARRTKKLAAALLAYRGLGSDFTAEQAMEFISSLDPEEIDAAMNPKTKQRLADLIAVKSHIDGERSRAQEIELDEDWKGIAKNSKTHNILSG